MSTLETLRTLTQAVEAAQVARREPSRWWPRRRAVEARYWRLATTTGTYALSHRSDVIGEAIARAAATDVPGRPPWWRVDVAQVAAELAGVLSVGDRELLEHIYAGARPEVDRETQRFLEDAAERLPIDTYRLAAAIPGCSKPHRDGMHLTSFRSDDQRALVAAYERDADLSRSVELWRGETPNARCPQFAEEVWGARPGDVLHRSDLPLSTTLDPIVATGHAFAFTGAGARGARSERDGWLLKIRTSRAIYVGSRDRVLGVPDGLVDELEAIIYAPELKVIAHDEVLCEGSSHAGRQRIHVLEVAVVPNGRAE